MSKPVTKGGFSNDGSKVMTQNSTNSANLCTTTLTTTASIAAQYDFSMLTSLTDGFTQPTDDVTITISTTLHASNLSLSNFYTIDSMSQFITEQKSICQRDGNKKKITKIAIQSPDELLVDCNHIITALKSNKYNHNDISFYILGDTSYSSCCVDHVAAQHVNADLIIHLGFACMSQLETIPVFYAFGVLSLLNEPILLSQHTNVGTPAPSPVVVPTTLSMAQLYSLYSPLLSVLFKISTTNISFDSIDYSPGYDDYDEYPDSLIYDNIDLEVPHFLIMLDQRYSSHLSLLTSALVTLGYKTILNNDIENQLSIEKTAQLNTFLQTQIIPYLNTTVTATNSVYTMRERLKLVLATPKNTSTLKTSSPSTPSTPFTQTTLVTTNFKNTLEFAGYTFTVSVPEHIPEDDIKSLSTKQIWHRFFNPSQWKIIFISNNIPFYTPTSLENIDKTNESDELQYKTVPDPASATFLTHLAMNFTQHYIFDCFPYFTLPFTTTRDGDDNNDCNDKELNNTNSLIHLVKQIQNHNTSELDKNDTTQFQSLTTISQSNLESLSTMSLFSPSNEQSRVLSQRFYLVEKAKNSSTIGIVAGTLSNQATLNTIERLKKLCQQNNIKYYIIIIGKINEAKLLNFGDISMFVVITCPMSVLFRFHNRHGQLHATTIDQWSLEQRLARQSAKNGKKVNTTSNAPATISSMVDMITPYECELAFNTNEFSWNGNYTTHFTDVNANLGRLGLKKEKITDDDLEAVNLTSTTTEKSSTNTSSNLRRGKDIDNDDDDSGVRYSSIDGKYHQIVKKSTTTTTTTTVDGENDNATSTQLIEQQTFGLIDPTTNKQLIYVKNNVTGKIVVKEREFTGLAQNFDLTEANMTIQPGLHGDAEGYISITDKKSGNLSAEKH